MEYALVEDEMEIKEKFNLKALHYEINYAQKKVKNEPVFKKWLESQKRERGKGKAFYCRDCKLFYYFINEQELNQAKLECPKMGYMCDYCGEMFLSDSYCCLKGGFKNLFYDLLVNGKDDDYYKNENELDDEEDNFQIAKLFPLTFNIFFFGLMLAVLYARRRRSTDSNIFDYYSSKDNYAVVFMVLVGVFMGFLYFFIFLIPNIIIYIIYIVLFLIHLFKKNTNYMF